MNAIQELTRQEEIILGLVAKGWRNAKIAQELVISRRTVEAHLYHIFSKLGVSSRTEAAIYVLQNMAITSTLNSEIRKNSDDRRINEGYAG
jgi:DNA-binding NarL/FixJ family response regulator